MLLWIIKKQKEKRMISLIAEKLSKSYKKRKVVDDVTLEVKKGEVVGLLGPNGAGKTTTFYMMTGIVRPESGKVFYNERDITELPIYKRANLGIGYLAQEPSVFRDMTVEENLIAILELKKYTPQKQNEEMEKLLAHLRPAPYPGTLVGRGGRAQPRPPVEVLVGGHVAGVLLVLQLLLLLWWDRGNSGS